MKQSAAFTLLSLLLLIRESHGFCPAQQHQRSTNSVLSLLPGQGNQLAAAYTASISRKDKHVDGNDRYDRSPLKEKEPPSSSSHWRALAASRSFVQRVFHLPSSAIKKHPHPALEGLKEHNGANPPTTTNHNGGRIFSFHFIPRPHEEKKEDYVLYPLIGFHFVKAKCTLNRDGTVIKTIALPTTAHAACRLPTNRNEELFGWFSPGCKLDLYSEDVCHKP